VNWTEIYTLIARMFRQPCEALRSMMAQDLCRLLKLGPRALTAEAREEHIAAAGKALAKDREMFATPQDAAPAVAVEAVTWALYDSQGFYETRDSEKKAKAFCEHYNKREADPLQPYTYGPLYAATSVVQPTPGQHAEPDSVDLDSGASGGVQVQKMQRALERIVAWELPEAFDREGNPSSFTLEYGSNGARDYFRAIAAEALK
jgi:hypothetical protein